MGDDITIGVTEIVNNIEVTAQPNDQIVDISVIDNADEVTLNITPTVIEINVNKGSSYARWGTIYGNLTDQTDLTNALLLKADLVDGKVPSYQLPSYVDDVIEVANYAALPVAGETGKIYVTLDNNKIYRWSGSVYIEVANNAVWGGITGTLSSQLDLQNALNLKKSKKTITILAVGQSNMCGHYTGGGDYDSNSNVKVWNGTSFVIADLNASPFIEQDLYGTHPNNNLAFHFAKQLQEDTDNEIRIITSMHTGQPIEYWNIGGSAWTELTTKISESLTTKIDIILFMQGEGNTSDSVSTYSTKFNTFLTNIRNLTSVNDNVPFICGELKEGTSYDTQNGFFDNLRSYVTDNFVVTAKTKELPVDGGINDPYDVHYSGASLVKIGRERFYNAFLNSNKNATDNTLEKLIVNTATPENGYNVINGVLSVGSNDTKIYTGSYLSSSTEAFVQARDLLFNKTLRLVSNKLIIEDDFASSIYTKVGINVDPLCTFHTSVAAAKTESGASVISLLSTRESTNPFVLSTMIYGATNLADRYVTLQTGDYGIADGGNLVLQQGGGNVAIGTLTATEKLQVNGNIKATSFIKSGGTSSQFLKADGSVDSSTYATTSQLHNAVTIGTANGLSLSTQQLSLALASASATGALSSTDWTTFNSKQSALSGTGFVKISGSTISYDNSTYALDSVVVKLTGDQAIAGIKTFSSDVKSTAFRLTGGTSGTGLYYGHTNKVVLANYAVGGGIDFETNGGAINMVLDASANLSVVGSVTASSIIKAGGTSTQFLKADGTVDGTDYVPTSRTLTINGTSYDLSANRSWTISAGVTGTGTTNYIPKFTGASAIGNSAIYDNSGNIGIGTTSPGTTTANTLLGFVNGSNIQARTVVPQIAMSANIDGDWYAPTYKTSNYAAQIYADGNGGTIALRTASSGTAGNSITWNTPAIYITNGGNVGIGTTSPISKLDVNGQVRVSDNSLLGFYQSRTSDTVANGVYGGNSFVLRNGATSEDLNFDIFNRSSSAWYTPMVIKNTGNVGIGTTSPSTKLDVVGAITASGGFFNSDMRLKDLTDYDYNVSDIKPITYLWKDGRDNKKHVGYSAQEVQKIMPDAVNEGTDGMLSVNYVEVLVAKIAQMEKEIELLKSK